ncbi:hypothetical protein Tco_0970931 [Tanacetum coccineum]
MLAPSDGGLILYQAYGNLYAMTGRNVHLLEEKQILSVGVFDENVNNAPALRFVMEELRNEVFVARIIQHRALDVSFLSFSKLEEKKPFVEQSALADLVLGRVNIQNLEVVNEAAFVKSVKVVAKTLAELADHIVGQSASHCVEEFSFVLIHIISMLWSQFMEKVAVETFERIWKNIKLLYLKALQALNFAAGSWLKAIKIIDILESYGKLDVFVYNAVISGFFKLTQIDSAN